jgi:hypothetical protein
MLAKNTCNKMVAKIETDQEEMITRMVANQERMNASLREEIKSGEAEMKSIVIAWIANMKDDRKQIMSCQVMTEACLDSKELSSEDMVSEVKHQEVCMEEAAVKSSETRNDMGRHLDAGCPHYAAVARYEGNIFREIVDRRKD